MKRLSSAAVFLASLALATGVEAQARRAPDVPPAYRPPPGMCRIWLEGVPPGQQPAPTDCATAVRNRPENGVVIFGDDYVKRDTSRAVTPKSFTETLRPGQPAVRPSRSRRPD